MNPKEEIKKEVKNMYDIAMGVLIDTYAENKTFFTQAEFEAHQAKILMLTHAKSKLDELASKV
jgi:hypothetical protein